VKILQLPDLHLTEKTPENRCDDYSETVIKKFEFILKTAEQHDVEMILQPGDFTDSPTMSWEFFIRLVALINHYNIKIYTVHGQHSLRYRNKGNTALDALEKSCDCLTILEKGNPCIPQSGIQIYGASYGEEIPKRTGGKFSILLIHKMILGDKKLWYGQDEDVTWSKNVLRKSNFDLIVSGDNHSQFNIYNSEGRHLFNPGTLLRDSSDMISYKPHIFLFDTANSSYKEIMVPIEPYKKVFKIDKITRDKDRDEEMEAFVEGIKNYRDVGLNFKENLFSYIKKNKVDDDIKDIFKDAFEEIGRKNNLGDSD